MKTKSKVNKKSSMEYKGNVTIKLMRGNKVFKTIKGHNSGGLPLFEFLTMCLGGSYVEENSPKYIRTFHTNGEIFNFQNPTISSGIKYSSIEVKKVKDNYITFFTFLIPGISLIKDKTTNMIAIYNSKNYNNLGNPSAYYFIGDDALNLIDESTNVVIIWEMSINN